MQHAVPGETFDRGDLAPRRRNAGIRQECTGMPSSQTVQAPQSPASQPFLTPNTPRSRRNVRKHCPDAGSAENSLPLTR